MLRHHRDRFEAERLRHELMGMGIGRESPLARLTPMRAVVIMAAIVAVLALITVITGGSGLFSGDAYADNVRALSAELRANDLGLQPTRAACLAGTAGSCADHQLNMNGQARRVDNQIAALFGFDLPREAANLNADYILALQTLEASYRAEAQALENGDREEFAAAAAETAAALEREAALIEQLNRDFPSAAPIPEP